MPIFSFIGEILSIFLIFGIVKLYFQNQYLLKRLERLDEDKSYPKTKGITKERLLEARLVKGYCMACGTKV